MANALYTLRQQLARLMGETILVTPAAAPEPLTTSSFGVAALAPYDDDYFLDWYGRFYRGTHQDTDFIVTASAKLNGKLTISPALATVVDTTDRAELYPDFTPQELNDAINLSIGMVEDVALQDVVDESIEVVDKVFEYSVPGNLAFIEFIFQETATANRYGPSKDLINTRHWRLLRDGGRGKIWFDDTFVSLTAGRNLRLVGQKAPGKLTLDSDLTEVRESYILYQAKALLHQAKIRGRGADFEEHREQMGLAQGMADRERQRLAVPGRGWKVSF